MSVENIVNIDDIINGEEVQTDGAVTMPEEALPEEVSPEEVSPEEAPVFNLAKYLGKEFEGTAASRYKSIEALAKGLNDVLEIARGKVRLNNLSEDQREVFSREFRRGVLDIPEDAQDYKLKTSLEYLDKEKKEEYENVNKILSGYLDLTQDQAVKVTGVFDQYTDSIRELIESSKLINEEETKKEAVNVYGDQVDEVREYGISALKKVIPHLALFKKLQVKSAEEFLAPFKDVGMADHPNLLALLLLFGSAYKPEIRSGTPRISNTKTDMSSTQKDLNRMLDILKQPSHPEYGIYLKKYNSIIEGKK